MRAKKFFEILFITSAFGMGSCAGLLYTFSMNIDKPSLQPFIRDIAIGLGIGNLFWFSAFQVASRYLSRSP